MSASYRFEPATVDVKKTAGPRPVQVEIIGRLIFESGQAPELADVRLDLTRDQARRLAAWLRVRNRE